MRKIILCLTLGLTGCRTVNDKTAMRIYHLTPFTDPLAEENQQTEYYVVENYNDDTSALRRFLNKFADTAIGSRPQKYEEFHVYIYKSTSHTNKDVNLCDLRQIDTNYNYENDRIANCSTWGYTADNKLSAPDWSFYKNDTLLNP